VPDQQHRADLFGLKHVRAEQHRQQMNTAAIDALLTAVLSELVAASQSQHEIGDVRHAWYAELLHRLATARDELATAIRETAVRGVLEKAITQREASQLIGVHEHTVARWRREHQQTQEPDT